MKYYQLNEIYFLCLIKGGIYEKKTNIDAGPAVCMDGCSMVARSNCKKV